MIIQLFACGKQNSKDKPSNVDQPNKTENQLLKYVQKPAVTDSICIKDIKKAKNDVSKGKIVFCVPMGFGSPQLRQEKRLRELCKKYNIVFDYEMFSDIKMMGQTQGCYGAYMDKIIAEKFGNSFKENLLVQADRILLASNDTVEYYLCDRRPQIPGKDEYNTTLDANVSDELNNELKVDKDGHLPFIDIGFYINKNGDASGYFINYFYDGNNESNQKFKDELYKIGVEKLKTIKLWETGMVNGQKVNTQNNVRVGFTTKVKRKAATNTRLPKARAKFNLLLQPNL
ncbi:hypothetical protein [Solitalea longa]|uniref:hypothetical protein n=1 Tax=Solitalea longa TaxID=2079460 RepID=UPI00105715FA|nr:hypothetical protein [Solitalea longa]